MISFFLRALQGWVAVGLNLAQALITGLLRGFLAPLGVFMPDDAASVRIERAPPSALIDVRHAVLRPGRPRETARFEGDDHPEARHWVAVQGAEIVGVASVIPAPHPQGGPARWQLRGMAVLPQAQGHGVGRLLLQALQREVAAPLWANARQGVIAFYTAQGWEVEGEPFDLPGIGPHLRIRWRP